MMRAKKISMIPTLALVLGLASSTAIAEDIDLGKHNEGDIKSTCESVNAKFHSDGQTYGCSKKCTGGTCSVICDKDDGCIGTTPARRLQGSNDERAVWNALNGSTNTTSAHDGEHFPWGLLGLLGLVGLLALHKRHERHANV
jgi:hypothetical protein